MAYVPPSIDPSASTFADLRRGGFSGILEAIIAANNYSVAEAAVIRRLVGGPASAQAGGVVANYIHGDPVDRAAAVAQLQEAARGAAVLLAAINEAAALADGDATSIVDVIRSPFTHVERRRVFP